MPSSLCIRSLRNFKKKGNKRGRSGLHAYAWGCYSHICFQRFSQGLYTKRWRIRSHVLFDGNTVGSGQPPDGLSGIRTMENGKDTLNRVKHAEEHFACEYNIAGKNATFGYGELEPGRLLAWEKQKRSSLVFILSGDVDARAGNAPLSHVRPKRFFFVPPGNALSMTAGRHPVRMAYCRFNTDLALCNRYMLRELAAHLPEVWSYRMQTYPLCKSLYNELEAAFGMMKEELMCLHYQQVKTDLIFMTLRYFYTREELALLFAPILGKERGFKESVLYLATEVDSVKDLASGMNMSCSSLKRKFRETFGTSVGSWLLEQKKSRLYNDLVTTNIPLDELAAKYGLSAGYLGAFCKRHFGHSPAELRRPDIMP